MSRNVGRSYLVHVDSFFLVMSIILIILSMDAVMSFSNPFHLSTIKTSYKICHHYSCRRKGLILSSGQDDDIMEDGLFDGYDRFIESLGQENTPNPGIRQNKKSFSKKKSKRQKDVRNRNYMRDPTDDMSIQVDEAQVYNLLSLRHMAQRKRDFVVADEIRDELNNVHGVYVWDNDRLWSTSPVSPSYRSARGTNQNDGYGIHGHDYVQIGDGINPQFCSCSLERIHELLAQRLQFKLLRKYDLADKVQTELYNHGVRVHDKLKQFRADGGIFSDVEGMVSNKDYTQNEYSLSVQDDSSSLVDNIQALIKARSDARAKLDYKLADMIRNELWKKLNVAVDDISRTWSVGGDFGPDGVFRWTDEGPVSAGRKSNKRDWRNEGAYTQSSFSKELANPDDEEEVLNLICDRLEARRVKDFQIADYILDYLYETYDISVDDRMRQWSVGGDFGGSDVSKLRTTSPTAPDGTLVSQPVRVYTRRGGTGQLSEKDLKLIDAMIQRRAEEMSRFNHKAADAIKVGLRKKYYLIIDDYNHSWHIRGNDYCLSPLYKGDIPDFIKESQDEIEKLIRERVQARGEKDFHRADAIRMDLFNTYGIKIDDRVKEWTIVSNEKKSDHNKIIKDETIFIENESDEKVKNEQNDEILNDESSQQSSSDKHIFTQEELEVLTVPKLKDLLRDYSLPVSGRKAELIQRLLEITN